MVSLPALWMPLLFPGVSWGETEAAHGAASPADEDSNLGSTQRLLDEARPSRQARGPTPIRGDLAAPPLRDEDRTLSPALPAPPPRSNDLALALGRAMLMGSCGKKAGRIGLVVAREVHMPWCLRGWLRALGEARCSVG